MEGEQRKNPSGRREAVFFCVGQFKGGPPARRVARPSRIQRVRVHAVKKSRAVCVCLSVATLYALAGAPRTHTRRVSRCNQALLVCSSPAPRHGQRTSRIWMCGLSRLGRVGVGGYAAVGFMCVALSIQICPPNQTEPRASLFFFLFFSFAPPPPPPPSSPAVNEARRNSASQTNAGPRLAS